MTFQRRIVTVVTMISGELDYTDVFGLNYNATNNTNNTDNLEIRNIQYPVTACIVWVFFLVFIPILLSNMLVSETL